MTWLCDREARLHRPGLDTDQRTRLPAPTTRKPRPRAGSGELHGHAGQRGAISEQLVLDLEIAGGRVCRAGLLVIEIAARHPGVRIRASASHAWVTGASEMSSGAPGPPILVGTQPGSSAFDRTRSTAARRSLRAAPSRTRARAHNDERPV